MNERQDEKARRSANALADAAGGGQDSEMPGKPFQSKLNPHLDEIRAARRGRKTWQEIADAITARHGIKTNASSVYEFARRRANRPAPFGFDEPRATASAAAFDKSPQPAPAEDQEKRRAETAPVEKAAPEAAPEKLAIQQPRPRPPAQARKRIFDFSEEELIALEKNPILPTDKPE